LEFERFVFGMRRFVFLDNTIVALIAVLSASGWNKTPRVNEIA
jgi:hypothetical protein